MAQLKYVMYNYISIYKLSFFISLTLLAPLATMSEYVGYCCCLLLLVGFYLTCIVFI